MEYHQNDAHRLLEIWLTGADQQDAACRAQSGALIREVQRRGYLPVVYRSGTGDLYESTAALLAGHRARAAERKHI